MNDYVPIWEMEENFRSFHNDLPIANQRKSVRQGNELVELVWQNGHVVMQSQTQEPNRETNKHDIVPSKNGDHLENSNNLNQEDETAQWMQYNLDDSLTKDFANDFFYVMPSSELNGTGKLGDNGISGERIIKFGFGEENNIFSSSSRRTDQETVMPPPKSQVAGITIPQSSSAGTSEIMNFSHFNRSDKIDIGKRRHSCAKDTRIVIQKEVGESPSMVTKLSGNWGINQIQKQTDFGTRLSSGVHTSSLPAQKNDVQEKKDARGQTETHDTTTTIASLSGGSGSSVGRLGQQISSNQSHKRKGRDTEESESFSEETENQSLEVGRRPQKSSTRRSRAAEVHNLSERRRRDRINEKMKALQELIPHCNKTDKASMLDEAIEYLKSLQLQVQIMWMGGSGTAPMVFPSAQQYMSLMGSRVAQAAIPPIHCSSQMPSIPMPNHTVPSICSDNQAASIASQNLNSANPSNPLQNSDIHDAYARYLGFPNMQPSSQAMNFFSSLHSRSAQPNQTTLTGSNHLPNEMNPLENIQNEKQG